MGSDITVAIITGVVTLLVGVIGARAAYKGAINGAKIQIEETNQKNIDAEIKKREFAKRVIEQFITHEIKRNVKEMGLKDLKIKLDFKDEPFEYTLNSSQSKFDEFNKIKYKLIEHESPFVQEVVDIYDIFLLIKRKNNLNSFNNKEYKWLKRVLKICVEKYSD